MSAHEAKKRLADGRVTRRFLNLLGLVHAYRCLTTEQLVAFSGDPAFASGRTQAIQQGFALELIETGPYSTKRPRWEPGNTVVRPSGFPQFFETRVEPHLTYPEWVAVTAGQEWSGHGREADRHNLLTTELLLRVAEFLDVGTVTGERIATEDGLLGVGVGRLPITSQQTADGVIVRRDGLRIAVEMTATRGRSLDLKVARIIRQLSRATLDETGLFVLFVVAPPEDEADAPFNRVRSALYAAINAEFRRNVPRAHNPFDERIGIVSWREWFPGHRSVDPERFFDLRVDRPTGIGLDWEEADLLDLNVCRFDPVPAFDPRAILDNCAGLAQTPPWLREGWDPPEHWRAILRDPDNGRRLEADLADILELYDDPVVPRPGVVQKMLPPRRLRGPFDPVSRTPDRWLGSPPASAT